MRETGTVYLPEWMLEGLPPEHRIGIGPISGDCMSGDRIKDGDFILFDMDRIPQNGDVVVATLTWKGIRGPVVKRLRTDPATLETILMPSNPEYDPIIVAPECDLVIEGVVVKSFTVYELGTAQAQKRTPGIIRPGAPGVASVLAQPPPAS
jgi:Peptidase S24-like